MKHIKRIIALALALALFSVPSFASLKAGKTASTNRVGLIAFTELCATRITTFNTSKGYDFDLPVLDTSPFLCLDGLCFDTSIASVVIDPDDFTVTEVAVIYMAQDASDDTSTFYLINTMGVISALEYDYAQDAVLSAQGSGAMLKGIEDFGNMLPALQSNALGAYATGEMILVYSGNYDYYLAMYNPTKETAADGINAEKYTAYVVARAR